MPDSLYLLLVIIGLGTIHACWTYSDRTDEHEQTDWKDLGYPEGIDSDAVYALYREHPPTLPRVMVHITADVRKMNEAMTEAAKAFSKARGPLEEIAAMFPEEER
jgi:hypothetical protein